MGFEITHFRLDVPSLETFKPLVYYCRSCEPGPGDHFYIEGMDLHSKVTSDDIRSMTERGETQELSHPYLRTDRDGLFLAPNGDVYLTDKNNPVLAPHRMIIARIPTSLCHNHDVLLIAGDLEERLIGRSFPDKVELICGVLVSHGTASEVCEQIEKILHREFAREMQDKDAQISQWSGLLSSFERHSKHLRRQLTQILETLRSSGISSKLLTEIESLVPHDLVVEMEEQKALDESFARFIQE